MRPALFDPGPSGLVLLIVTALFLPALFIFMLRATVAALRTREIRYRGTLYRQSESAFWYWLVMLLVIFCTAFVGLSALVLLTVLLFRTKLPVFS